MKRILKSPLVVGLLTISLTVSLVFLINSTSKTVKPKTGQEYSLTSVMITRYDGRSGGSGVILSSSKNSSQVLTNAHVCEVVKNGGIVRSDYGKGIVKNYKVSQLHDLCMITTNNNFKVNTVLAQEAPDLYEDASVVGHPHLLSTIVTKGHFSQKGLITIMVGTKKCVLEDTLNPRLAPYCAFFGVIPIIKTYESQVASCTIMPGSSGSPVFNSKGEIAGLVFAGSGDFGYAQIVPYEYVSNFVEYELPSLQVQVPNELAIDSNQTEEKVNFTKACSGEIPAEIKSVCEMISKSLLLLN
jgi:S1-C subfamily serine protease